MKVLVLGSGGREHALVLKLKNSANVDGVYAIPGNAGISEIAVTENIPLTDNKKIILTLRSSDLKIL